MSESEDLTLEEVERLERVVADWNGGAPFADPGPRMGEVMRKLPTLLALARRALTPAAPPPADTALRELAAEMKRHSAICAVERGGATTAVTQAYWIGRADAFTDAASLARALSSPPSGPEGAQ